MFTGIVRKMGTVASLNRTRTGRRLEIAADQASGARAGESFAVNGVCLTCLADGRLDFDVVPETLARTSLGRLRKGSRVNLEPALRAGDPIGGHFVQGHVDATGEVVGLARTRGVGMRVLVPPGLSGQIVQKGFVAVDGVSLTVVEAEGGSFSVALVPYTRRHTTLGSLRKGDRVNVEVDILGKYARRRSSAVTRDFLRRAGFA